MSAHFDGGAEIAGRRLREVEVMYVDDETLNLDAEDSDDCPPSPPPTYYLRVRDEKGAKQGGEGTNGNLEATEQVNGDAEGRQEENGELGWRMGKNQRDNKGWSWRYVNVEKKSLLIWNRRGGRLLKRVLLRNVELLRVIPDEESVASILEVHTSAPDHPTNVRSTSAAGAPEDAATASSKTSLPLPPPPPPLLEQEATAGGGGERNSAAEGGGNLSIAKGGVLVLQARSRTETMLWAKVLQENVELMTKRVVPLENLDKDTSLSEVQQLAKLLTHQLSELQDAQASQQPPPPHALEQEQQLSPRTSEQPTLADHNIDAVSPTREEGGTD